MVIKKQDIIDSFGEIGLDVNADVVDKCIEICCTNGVDSTELVETWMAYTISNSGDAVPNTETISQMEKKMFSKRNTAIQMPATPKTSSLKVYTAAAYKPANDDMVDIYSSSTKEKLRKSQGKSFWKKLRHPVKGSEGRMWKEVGSVNNTPKSNNLIIQRSAGLQTPRILFSPASFSPKTIAESQKYSERTNSGQVVCKFGSNIDSSKWRTSVHYSAPIEPIEQFKLLSDNERYMYDTLADKLRVLLEHTECMSKEIIRKYSLEISYSLMDQTLEPVPYVGRICCDTDGRLNASSLLLEYGESGMRGESISLDISKVPDYSLFPGQVIGLDGKNPNGNMIFAEKIYMDVPLPESPEPKGLSKLSEPLQVVITAGPYTPSDTLSYQPVEDLLQYVLNYNPHVLVLIGPIVDALHPNIEELAETFTQCYDRVLEGIVKPLSKKHTKIIVMSCWREAGHHVIYPTPPSHTILKKQYPNLHILPDPSIINIAGVNFGFTAADILMHLGKEEIFKSSTGPGMDRLARLASHIIQQRSFYPLSPHADEMSVDSNLWWEYSQIPIVPHILILPSDLRYFVKFIRGCLVINPERLTKGQVGGSFARMEIRLAAQDEIWSPLTHVDVQVVKV